jgi:hypothetical protein
LQLLHPVTSTYLGAEVCLIAELPSLSSLVQVASQAGLELQAEVLRRVCDTDQLHDTIDPAGY